MKTYVITGATSGIGKALVEKLVNGNIVFTRYRNKKDLQELEKLGAIPFFIDMKDGQSIAEASEFIKSKTDKVDTLINVAGCVSAGVMEQLPVEKIREQFEVNTF